MSGSRSTESDRRRGTDGVLLASAFVLAGFALQGARGPSEAQMVLPGPASAGSMAVGDDHVLIPARSGRGDDADPEQILFVIDSRQEWVSVYEVEDARREEVFYRGGGSLQGLFRRARGG